MGTFVLHFKMNKSVHHMNNHTIYCLARHAGQYLLGLFMLSGLSTANSTAQTLPKDLSQKAATYLYMGQTACSCGQRHRGLYPDDRTEGRLLCGRYPLLYPDA